MEVTCHLSKQREVVPSLFSEQYFTSVNVSGLTELWETQLKRYGTGGEVLLREWLGA